MNDIPTLQGGCLCGDLRYAFSARPVRSGYCHCRMCQRNTGAPAVAWVEVPTASFRYLAGHPRHYRSSAWAERQFCARCGSYLVFRDINHTETVSVNTATLDDPAQVPPTHHIFCSSRIPWFDTADDLPRYPDAAPPDQA